eukprot:453622_1
MKINEYCNESICNLLTLGDTQFITTFPVFNIRDKYYISYPSLSINGQKNYLNISIRNSRQVNEIYVPNADAILPKDNQFHHIYLSLKANEKLFKIDGIAYYSGIDMDLEQTNSYFIAELEEMNRNNSHLSTIWHPSYPLYMSNPWNYAINAIVQNICIRSSPNIVGEIQCNKKINVIENIFIGDTKYFKLILSQNTYDIKFNLIALKLRYEFSFRVYDINFNVLYELISNKYSLISLENIIINSVNAGDYLIRFEFTQRSPNSYARTPNVPLYCDYKSNTDKYIVTELEIDENNWSRTEWACENKYGTTLAT